MLKLVSESILKRQLNDTLPSPEEWRRQGRDVRFRGHRLFVRQQGDGPAVLLLHAFPTSSYDFARLAPC